MFEEVSVNQWVNNFENGVYSGYDVDTQINAGWYDWFCQDTCLSGKTKSLGSKVKKIHKILGEEASEKIYVFFKNNCPLDGRLYDDFRLCDRKSGDVLFTIVPRVGYNRTPDNEKAEVWSSMNDFDGAIFKGAKWVDILNWFKENKEEIVQFINNKYDKYYR